MVGLEPTRLVGHWILNPARLPVPPHRLENLRRDIMSGERSRVKCHRFDFTSFPAINGRLKSQNRFFDRVIDRPDRQTDRLILPGLPLCRWD